MPRARKIWAYVRNPCWVGASFALLAVVACSLQTPAPPPAKPVGKPNLSVVDATAAQVPMLALDLRPPLLADPRLLEASRALERGDDAKALELFEQALGALAADAPEKSHWHLWLAYAYQKRQAFDAALGHFQAASEANWMLRDYATLGLAQCHFALGRIAYASQLAQGIQAEAPLLQSVQLFRSEVLLRTGQQQAATNILRAYLKEHTAQDHDRAAVALQLAEMLVAPETANVGTTGLALNPADAGNARADDAALKEALALLDTINGKEFDRATSGKFHALKATIISKLFLDDPNQKQQCAIRNQAEELEALVDAREFKRALALADGLMQDLERNQLLDSTDGCRVRFASAQAHLSLGEPSKGNSELDAIVKTCTAPDDIVSRAIFLLARRAQDRHELAKAIGGFEELEKRFPKHRLTDDARLRVAFAYLELGSESRFTESIQRLVDDFPESDSAAEGLFQLALRAMAKSDWSAAASVLAQLGRLPKIANHDFVEDAERQLFFLSRAQQHLGQNNEAAAGYERLIRDRPFSYYMLSAYSQLLEIDRERALQLRAASCVDVGSTPFSVPYQPQFEKSGFTRAMELMALGEVQRGAEELKTLGLPREIEPLFLWSQASFEATAGSLKNSQRLVRERMRDWPRRWPSGAWESAWRLAFPRPYLEIVARESKRTGVQESLIYAIMREESQFDRDAVSRAEAYGLMQLIIPTAKTAAKGLGIVANASTLVRPSVNVALGSQVLAKLLSRFDELPVLAIPAYNAGPGRPARWLKERPNMDFDVWVESIPFSETRTYVKHVLASWSAYAWLYDREHADAVMKLPLRLPN